MVSSLQHACHCLVRYAYCLYVIHIHKYMKYKHEIKFKYKKYIVYTNSSFLLGRATSSETFFHSIFCYFFQDQRQTQAVNMCICLHKSFNPPNLSAYYKKAWTNYLLDCMCTFTSCITHKQLHKYMFWLYKTNHSMAFYNIHACTSLMFCNHGYDHLDSVLL